MSNTPTESEFDKELKLMIDKIGHAGANGDSRKETQTIYLKAFKQAVDKHVIGEDDKNYPFAESDIVNIEGYNTLMGGRNLLRREQHNVLYGGDKK